LPENLLWGMCERVHGYAMHRSALARKTLSECCDGIRANTRYQSSAQNDGRMQKLG
jgi:hypothetical protein